MLSHNIWRGFLGGSAARPPGGAREVLEYSLSLRPEDSNAAYRLGNMFLGAWDLDRAEAVFRGLQERRPDPFFASRLDAIRSYERSLALNPDNANAKKMLETLKLP